MMMTPRLTVAIICILLSVCTLIAGCICSAPGGQGPTPTPVPTPGPEPKADFAGWGTDRDTYTRNATATGWVNVTNTGSVPIDRIDFTIVISRTVLFVPVEKTFSYNATGLGIRPGETRQVRFSQVIPAEYGGISTAGDYQFTVTATIAGRTAGSYAKDITVT
jgi:hypothetical protein